MQPKTLDFKVLAIVPYKGPYSKVLTPGIPYYFYNFYSIEENRIIYAHNKELNNLYSEEGISPNITVSAIAGKNGTGKSTLIELLFMAINNIAINFFEKEIKKVKPKLLPVSDLEIELYIQKGDDIFLFALKKEGNFLKRFTRSEKLDSFELSPIYGKPFKLKDFFYSVAVNYSHYSLNAIDFGKWIERLFHKNDGYQTPLVINPMRTDGNIDINEENHLIVSRLVANLLAPTETKKHWKLTDKQEACGLILCLNPEKVKTIYSEKRKKRNGGIEEINIEFTHPYFKYIQKELIKKIYETFGPPKKGINRYLKTNLEKYILKKLVKIARTYPEYRSYFIDLDKGGISFSKPFNNTAVINGKETSIRVQKIGFQTIQDFTNYLSELKDDRSHITFKLRQAINFLRYEPISHEDKSWNYHGEIPLDLEKLSSQLIEVSEKSSEPLINLLPPSLFKIDIELKTVAKDTNPRYSKFNLLSSGEKQLIHTANSIYYHLLNIDSVFNRQLDNKRATYESVNIILEEIELYFHPETQRKYVSYFLDGIKLLNLKKVRGINICFVTHSPYILSDIPNSHVLFLTLDPTTQLAIPYTGPLATFGANINDLLSNSFFMQTGLIGEFAKNKIQNIIDNLNTNAKPDIKLQKEEIYNLISVIGEPFLKNKLISMYYHVYNDDEKKHLRIQELQSEIERLKSN